MIRVLLRSHRDVLLARQKARQIAVLFRFSPREQACIAAGAFAVAAQALRRSRSGELCIQVVNTTLHVFAQVKHGRQPSHPPASLRVIKTLPAAGPGLAAEDVAWLVKQLNQHTRQRVFEEIEQQNREMLTLLYALQTAHAKIEQLSGIQPASAAA